tara:strand:+ start:492 stop:890 length:399 start_codon:yes stop_codon:yes gene_type:complete
MDNSNLQYQLFKQGYYEDKHQNEEYKKLVNSLSDLKDIQTDLNELLLQQDEKINDLEEKSLIIEDKVKDSLNNLVEADKLYFSYTPILTGGILGMTLLSPPTAFLLGAKYVGYSLGLGGILGSISGYKLQKL